MKDMYLDIYTDGACKGNPGPGAWAAILIWNGKLKRIKGFENDTTNNRMELTAAIEGLKAITRSVKVRIYTDSEYLRKGITEWIQIWQLNDWKKGTIKNKDLWQQLLSLTKNFEVKWHWVKAHNGNPYNEMVDKLARDEIKKNLNFFGNL